MILTALLILPAASVLASSPTGFEQSCTGITYELSAYGTYVSCASAATNAWYDSYFLSGTYINFTNYALTLNTNPTQNFGIGIQSANASISGVTTTNLQFGETAASSGTSVNATFYYSGTVIPIAVVIEDGGTNYTYTASGSSFDGGFTAQYVVSSASYTAATAGVYAPTPGADSGHLDIKDQWHSTTTVVVYYRWHPMLTVPVTMHFGGCSALRLLVPHSRLSHPQVSGTVARAQVSVSRPEARRLT